MSRFTRTKFFLRNAWSSFRADAGLGIVGSPSPDSDYWYHAVGMRSGAGPTVTPATAIRLGAVFACTRVVTETFGSLPCAIYRERKSGGRDRATDHPAQELFLYPNEWQTGMEFFEMMQGHLELRGNAYALKVPGNGRAIDQLIPLHPDRVKVFLLPNNRLRYEVSGYSTGRIDRYSQDEILHLRGWSFDGVMGISTVSAMAESIGVGIAQQDHRAAYFRNHAIPGMAIETVKMEEEAREQMVNSISERFSGPSAFKVFAPPPGSVVKMLGLTNKDSQLIEASQATRTEICAAWRVPPHKIADLTRGTFCLPAGTDVLTVDGPKPIEGIAVGERVWSRSDNGEWIRSKILRSECSGVDSILKLSTTNRTLRANAKHRILARRKYPNPKSGKGGYQTVRWVDEYVQAGDLRIGDTIIAMDGNFAIEARAHTHTPTNRHASLGFMAFCGLLLGDGSIHANHGVSIARHVKASYMDFYRSVMRTEFVRYEGYARLGNTVLATSPVVLEERQRDTRFSSVLAARELTKLGLAGTAHTKTVPGWVFSMSEEQRLYFLRGFVDADGSVDKKGRISMSSCNRGLLTGMRHLCMMSGIPVTNLRCQKGQTTLPNGKSIRFEQWTFTCSDPRANRRIGSATPEYMLRLNNGKPFDRKARSYPRFGAAGDELVGASMSRIVAIRTEAPEPVYDIEVEGTHNFVADGVIVHNSNIEQQNIEFATDCMRPRIVRFERRLDRDIISALRAYESSPGDYYMTFNMDALFRGDMKNRYDSYVQALSFMTRNEIRAAEGKNPIDDPACDELLVAVNMETITQAQTRNDANNAAANESATDRNDSGVEQDQQDSGGSPETPSDDNQGINTRDAHLQSLVLSAAGRLVRREVKALRKMQGSSGAFHEKQLLGFYADLAPVIAENLAIPIEAANKYCSGHALTLTTAKSSLIDFTLDLIEEDGPQTLATIALGEQKALKAAPVSADHDSRPIHVTLNPQISLPPMPPMEIKMTLEQQKTVTTKTGTAVRGADGKLSFTMTEDNSGF